MGLAATESSGAFLNLSAAKLPPRPIMRNPAIICAYLNSGPIDLTAQLTAKLPWHTAA